MERIFGTDGIRGEANRPPMTVETAVAVGKAVARLWAQNNRNFIVLGKDPRLSGDMFEAALVSGILSQGIDARTMGILPTPAVAFLTTSLNAGAGIMISASHNPFHDNGIKIFRPDGYKLSDAQERDLEALILNNRASGISLFSGHRVGKVSPLKDAEDRYADFLRRTFSTLDLKGMKVVMDCSNGATFRAAPRLFDTLGAALECIAVTPDGENINAGCGSQHPETVSRQVIRWGADIGLAFDGDGDRLIAVDEKGRVITGDQIIAVCAMVMKKHRQLKNNTVVTTVMSNLGLCHAFKEMGIRHFMAPVGDRYVLEKMIKSGAVIGGEDSGHMIFLSHHTTGDGILTALKLIEAMQAESKPLSALADIMTVFPQALLNIPVQEKPPVDSIPEIMDAVRAAEAELGEMGRVLVRYSGTQPLCRVMVEGPTDQETRAHCERIAAVIRKKIGMPEPIPGSPGSAGASGTN